MKAPALKAAQSLLKDQYYENPVVAKQTLTASGIVDPANLSVTIVEPVFFNPAGLHPAGGGDGTFACPVEIMLAGLVTCAGVTLAAVANSMHIELRSAKISATGDMDFRGTLGVDKQAPVGLTAIRLMFEIDTETPAASLDKLMELTHRYCVFHRTLDAPPKIETKVIVARQTGE